MRQTDGRILVPGFYDDVRPLTHAERRALAGVPDVDEELRRSLGLARTEAGSARLAERIVLPALNVRGVQPGFVGGRATNAIPTDATASIDFRLVPDQRPARIRALVKGHVRRQGFFVVTQEPDSATRRRHPRIARPEWGDGYPATRTSMTLPVSRAVSRVVSDALGQPVIQVPSLGGSLPMYLFAELTKAPLIIVPIVNHDNNQHAPNENLRMQNLWDGIEVYGALLARLGTVW